jgi:hypothetical protein
MKITIRRGTSRKTYGYLLKWDIYADEELIGSIKDKQKITFELNNVKEIRITGFLLTDAVIPIDNSYEDIEIRCLIFVGMWKQYIYAYALSKGKYLGEYNF